jgi:hypothetical protein
MARPRRGFRIDSSKLATAQTARGFDSSCGTGCTQLANAAGLPFSAVHKARCRQRRAGDDVIEAIADGLNVSVNALK